MCIIINNNIINDSISQYILNNIANNELISYVDISNIYKFDNTDIIFFDTSGLIT